MSNYYQGRVTFVPATAAQLAVAGSGGGGGPGNSNPNHWSSYGGSAGGGVSSNPFINARITGKVGFQQMARKTGRDFEESVVRYLSREGWQIKARRAKRYGVEIDIVAAPPSGPECYIECKGGTMAGRSGLARTDTVKKSIGLAWTLQRRQYANKQERPRPYLLVTSMMPKPNSPGMVMLDEAVQGGLFEHVGTVQQVAGWGSRFFFHYPSRDYYLKAIVGKMDISPDVAKLILGGI